MTKIFVTILLLFLSPIAWADSVQSVSSALLAGSPVPFQVGVADGLAADLLSAQASIAYASPISLELSIDAVIRAIGIDGTAPVGWAAADPITWLQSDIAINPAASLSFTPSALYFGSVAVVDPAATPEPATWVMVIISLVVAGSLLGWKWLRKRPVPADLAAPIIMTKYGAVSEPARKRAALNMREDPELMERVTKVVASELMPPETLHATQLCSIIEPIIAGNVTLNDEGMLDLLHQVLVFLKNYEAASMAMVQERVDAEMRRRYPEAFDADRS